MKHKALPYSLKYALKGLHLAMCYEANFRIQCLVTCFVIIAGFLCHLSIIEWCIILFCNAMVLCLELMNTSIEFLANYCKSNYDLNIKVVKDIAASSVLLMSIFSIIIGGLIFLPKCLVLFKSWKVILN